MNESILFGLGAFGYAAFIVVMLRMFRCTDEADE